MKPLFASLDMPTAISTVGDRRRLLLAPPIERAAWRDMGRPGLPQLWGQGYFALGNETAERGAAYLKHYYDFTGPFAEKIAAGLLNTTQSVIHYVKGYEEAGCDELVLMPTLGEAHQLDRLADVCASL